MRGTYTTRAPGLRRLLLTLALITATAAWAATATAATQTVTLTPEADTYVNGSDPTSTHGGDAVMDVYAATVDNGCGAGPRLGLLRFDLSSLPVGATIVDASLELTSRSGFAYDGDPEHYAVFLPDDSWAEGAVTWDTRPADGLVGNPLPVGWQLFGENISSSPFLVGRTSAFESAGCGVGVNVPQSRPFASANLTSRLNSELRADPGKRVSLEVTTFACGTPATVVCQSGGQKSYFLHYDSRETDAGTPPQLHLEYTVQPDNDVWTRALPIALNGAGSGNATGQIDQPGQARWYRFGVTPGSRVSADLTNLATNYDVAIFSDIGQAFRRLTSIDDLEQLSAEFAADAYSPSVFSPSVFSPSVFSPSVFSPSVFSPSVFSPSVFSPSVFSPSVFSPSVFSPSVFSPSVFSPSVFSPSVFSDGAAYESAQVRSIMAVAAKDGTADEHAEAETWNNTGQFYVRISGRNGAYAPDAPFDLGVHLDAGTCTGVGPSTLPLLTPAVLTGRRTLVLANYGQMTDDGGLAAMRTRVTNFAARSEILGAVVNLGAESPRVAFLDQQADTHANCPYAKNLMADAIREIVQLYRTSNTGLQYVVIVGGDEAVPFFRYPDTAGLGPEADYVPPVRDTSASQASLRLNYILSQDAYGTLTDLQLKGETVPVPDLAVGRVVETPTEISGVLDAYTTGTTAGVAPRPTSSLVTGYDFLADAGQSVRTELVAGLGTGATNDQLITNQGVPPATTGTPPTASWTAAQLRTQLLGRRHDLIFLAGHFSANNALAADYSSTLNASELAASNVNLANSVVFSAGCHAGYTIVNDDGVPTVTQTLDWVQAFASRRATLIAGTGYQYGDTDFLEYSERLYTGFAKALRAGTGPVAVGDALVTAKQAYLEATPQLRGIHRKALLEATLYGLPMLRINLPAGRTTDPGSTSLVSSTTLAGTAPGSVLGLRTADVSLAPVLASQPRVLVTPTGTPAVTATYLTGPSGVVTNPGEPTLPLLSSNVSVAGQVLRGVGFRGATFTDTPGVTPLTGAPATELNAPHAPFVSAAFFPARLWTLNYFGALADNPTSTRLNLTPAQYRSDAPGSLTDVLRRYTNTDLRLFYSANTQAYDADGGGTNRPGLAAPPTVARVDASVGGGSVSFDVRVVGDPSAGIQGTWVTYTGVEAGTWTSLDLVQNGADSSLWRGTLTGLSAAQANALEFIVQSVNGVGLVSLDDNQGAYYSPGQIPPTTEGSTPLPRAATALVLDSPTAGNYNTAPTVSATLTAGGTPLAGKPVTLAIGGSPRTVTTNAAGVATAAVPIVDQPGDTTVSATFDGDGAFVGSSASAPFTVGRLASSLALTVTAPSATLGADTRTTATLTSGGVALPQKTVAFVLSAPSRPSIIVTRVTDLFGRANLGIVAVPPGQNPLPIGGYTVTAYFGPPAPGLALPADAIYASSVSPARTLGVVWPGTGFLPTLANPPTVVSWKAGNLLPAIFSLGGNRGQQVLAPGSPTSTPINCTTKAPTGAAQATSGVLIFVPIVDVYTYTWVTTKSWAGTCRQFNLGLADGTTRIAYVRFTS